MPTNESSSRGRPEAAAVVWAWREPPSQGSTESADRFRRAGALRAGITFGLAAIVWGLASAVFATVIAVIGTITLISALVWPSTLYRRIHRAAEWLGRRVGLLIGQLFLPVVFFLVFVPMAGLRRARRKDPLGRDADANARTYWTRRDGSHRDANFYRRQY